MYICKLAPIIRCCEFSIKNMCLFQVVVVLQQVFALIQTVLSKWLNDSQVVEVRWRHVHMVFLLKETCLTFVFEDILLRLILFCL